MFFLVPKGPRAVPFIMVVLGVLALFSLVPDMYSYVQNYSVFNVFDNTQDDYDKYSEGYLLIDELALIEFDGYLYKNEGCRCIAEFKDGTGKEHYVTLEISDDDERYEEVIEASEQGDITSIKLSGLFSASYFPSETPLYDEKVNRIIHRMRFTDYDNYKSYIIDKNTPYMLKNGFFIVLCILDVAAGVWIWINGCN